MKALFTTLALLLTATIMQAQQQYFQLKKYQINGPEQEARMDNYLKNAFLPAAHKAGIKHVGIFKPVASDKENHGKYIYVFLPFQSLAQMEKFPDVINADKTYLKAADDYINAVYNNAPYVRIESTWMKAFSAAPKYALPKLSTPKSERIYELRSYEGHTEAISKNKIKQFNVGSAKAKSEVAIFDRLGFNAVFYGEAIAGSTQPNMIYMTTFANKAERDAHWNAFRDDAEWGVLRAEPEYQNNVSKNVTLFLYPTDYSDI